MDAKAREEWASYIDLEQRKDAWLRAHIYHKELGEEALASKAMRKHIACMMVAHVKRFSREDWARISYDLTPEEWSQTFGMYWPRKNKKR